MGSRLEYYILRSKFKQRINVGKGINIQKKSLKERFLVMAIFFVVYLVLGLLIIFMKDFPLDMNIGIDCLWNSSHRVFFYKRNVL
jgi:hypothetical protein